MSERTTKENERSTKGDEMTKENAVCTLDAFLAECERGYLSLETALPDMQKLLRVVRVQALGLQRILDATHGLHEEDVIAREAQAQVRGIVNDSNEM